MSSGGWDELKKPLYGELRMASRLMQSVGNKVGWQGLEDEGKYNQKNPGHAATKITEYAVPALLGAYFGGGSGAEAAAPVIDESAGLAMNAATTSAQQAAEQQALQTALEGAQNTTMESALTNTGYTPSSLRMAVTNANSANGTSLGSNLANYGRNVATQAQNGGLLNSFMSGSGTGKGSQQLATQYGLGLLNQKPQQPAMSAPPPRQQASLEPLPLAYGQHRDSLGMGMTEEEKRRRLMMQRGYR